MFKVMIGVTVEANSVTERISKAGNAYRRQSLWVDMGKSHPVEIEAFVDKEKPNGFPPGKYFLDESAVFKNQNGDLVLSFRNLKPQPPNGGQSPSGAPRG